MNTLNSLSNKSGAKHYDKHCRASPDSKDFAYRSLSSFGQFCRNRPRSPLCQLLICRLPGQVRSSTHFGGLCVNQALSLPKY
jgi:hypothetical protein